MGSKILVVEDDHLTRRFLIEALKRVGGFEVAEAKDPDEAIAKARAGSFDLVLMDVALNESWLEGEEADGLIVTRVLKQDPATRAVPILLISAFDMPAQAAEMMEVSGADGYVQKPIEDLNAFIGHINGFLSRNRQDA